MLVHECVDLKQIDFQTNRLPDISPGKMGLFLISRELQFGVCNHGETYKVAVSPLVAREGECFYRGENKVGRVIINKESMAFHWLSPSKERSEVFLLPFGFCCHCRA